MEPIKNKNGRILTFDYSKSFTGVTRSELNMFADLIKLDFQQLVSSNQDFVDLYEFIKQKLTRYYIEVMLPTHYLLLKIENHHQQY